jgi:hypothetical protein
MSVPTPPLVPPLVPALHRPFERPGTRVLGSGAAHCMKSFQRTLLRQNKQTMASVIRQRRTCASFARCDDEVEPLIVLGGAANVKMMDELPGERSTVSPDSTFFTLTRMSTSSMFTFQRLLRSVYEDVDVDGTRFDEIMTC